jgi:hypothetical protein
MLRMELRWIVTSAIAALAYASDVQAEPAKLNVSLQCERATEPGRVKCSVEAKPALGDQIRWGDVQILQTPDFAQPLKGRIGPREATSRDDAVWRWSFAVVAKHAGSGAIVARVRALVCSDKERCIPQSVEIQAVLQVGG